MNDAFANMVAASPIPPQFNNDAWLMAVNLFLFTAFTYIAGGSAIGHASAMWANRRWDKWNHPVTLHRFAWFAASMAAATRCGPNAAVLWAWMNPDDVATIRTAITVRSYTDPLSLVFAWCWLMTITLTNEALIEQLRKQPFPVKMMTKAPALVKPALLVLISFTMAFGVVFTRG